MRRVFLATAISAVLVGCGGGGGSSGAPTSNANPATNQAVLGPLSGATINAYRLTDLSTAIEGPITATTGTGINTTGQFALALNGIADDEWILVSASNGDDIDANDDGTADALTTRNSGIIYGVAKASTWKAGEGKLTALSDLSWRYAQDQIADTTALEIRLEALADWLIASDITGDSNITYDDLIRFTPSKAATQAAIDYSALLPNGDSTNPSYIDQLHLGYTEPELDRRLQTSYGATPWIADTIPAILSFSAVNNVDFSQSVESARVTVSEINRAAPVSISNGEYSINGAAYTSGAGMVNRGDEVSVRLTSANNYATPTTATLTIGGVEGHFVATTYSLDATPDAFSFTDQTDVARNAEIESNLLTISGINSPAAISISNGEYSINNAAFTSDAGTVSSGDTVKLRLTASAEYAKTVNATLTIGGVSDSFDLVTTAYDADNFLTPGGPLGTLGMPMVMIDAAGKSFVQGCSRADLGEPGVNHDPSCRTIEKPERMVTFVKSFAIGAHEVTFDAWDACVSDGGCNAYVPPDWSFRRGTRPVMNVSYDDIQSFITWLNSKTGKTFRLPSESEWEYAARAGSSTIYPWGNTAGINNANCTGCRSEGDARQTEPVGSFAANAFGLYDMEGNVREWVEDIYHNNYTGAPVDGSARTTGSSGEQRVIRGGDWAWDTYYIRPTHRSWRNPSDRVFNVGFRLAQDL